MTMPTIGGNPVPATFGGHVMLHHQLTKPNGAGSLVHYGEQWYEWQVAACTAGDWDWWWSTYERGSALPCSLYQDDSQRTLLSFTEGVVWEPSYQQCEGGVFEGVKIQIHSLLPLLT